MTNAEIPIKIIVGLEHNGAYGIRTAWTVQDIDLDPKEWAYELHTAHRDYKEVRIIKASLSMTTLDAAFGTVDAGVIA